MLLTNIVASQPRNEDADEVSLQNICLTKFRSKETFPSVSDDRSLQDDDNEVMYCGIRWEMLMQIQIQKVISY